ncbi:MAG: hypothetical protein ISS52_04380 [Dehalococcoidia bacterium]|nr:hypothetical protein [Dehalococcoidia bacterium]
MKKLLFSLSVILVMTVGCTCLPGSLSGGNQAPAAYIDAISPADASLGEAVSFQGHGTDADGDVVAYRWRSDVDGDLGTTATFETSSLSAGAHVVYFKVQDNNGDWSDEVRTGVTVSGDAANAPVVDSFGASPGTISLGGSSTLSWSVSAATNVSIDQTIGDVALEGTMAVSPAATTTYTLTATNEAGSGSATTQVVVSAASPPSAGLPVINSFAANPWAIAGGASSTLNWSVSGATVVEISQGIGSVGSTGSVSVSPDATSNYTLTATSAVGWSSVTIQVVVIGEAGEDATPPSVPVLVSPAEGAVLPQPTADPWPFDWEDSTDPESGVKQYQIYVILSGAPLAKIDETTGDSAWTEEPSGGTVFAPNCFGWTWKVRAQNNAGLWSDWSAPGSFDVEPPVVPPEEHTVTLVAEIFESGYVLDNGELGGQVKYILVGDDADNRSLQGFLSFDISGIPAGATITEVIVDFEPYEIEGDPFGDLDCLRAYVQDYGTLQGADYFAGSPTGARLRYCSAGQMVAESNPFTILDALQSKVGSDRFQLRLQFNSKASDDDGMDDYVRWKKTVPDEPTLIVTYTSP